MFKIRKNIFETNSSSTHSIVLSEVPLDDHDYYNSYVVFEVGDFGWEMNVIKDSWGRASYFYTAACILYERDVKEDIINLLCPLGIDCIFNEENPPKFIIYDDSDYKWLENGNIDHVEDCQEFVDTLMNDADALARFILSDKSFIVTGNDNCDEIDYDWMQRKVANADLYSHRVFYKGN